MTQEPTDKERQDLLDKLKVRYHPGVAPATLVETKDVGETSLKLQWMFYAGMGETDFHNAQPQIKKIAENLLTEGKIARGIPFFYYNTRVQPLKLLEDLNWALDKNDGVVLLDLGKAPGISDRVLPVNATYDAASAELVKRIRYGHAMIDQPLRLANNEVVRPIVMDANAITIRQRQQAYTHNLT